jgi:predicted oxidoreductase
VAAYRKLEVAECTDVIHHYWSRKAQFRAKIQAWLRKHGHDPLSQAALADVSWSTTSCRGHPPCTAWATRR